MPEITVTIKIQTDDPVETKKAVHKYLLETLQNEFLQDWHNEGIISIETDQDGEEE